MKAKVHVTLKNGVLDPQGKAIAQALHGLGFDDVGDVRQGKFIEVDLPSASDAASAEASVKAMCEKLLANPVIEDYQIELSE
ncbi:MAG: phosphoribosylformylglycinamidine synthase subunit PurS [Alphaproteobacteria bacterium]|nr:phosphoribosylformylglycinamidine synthase subunit PurS [Alphaproteobacteria bacterium SS10]